MFSSMKMAEYMKSELSGIFQGKLVMKSMLLGSPGTHFMHMRVNKLERKALDNTRLAFAFRGLVHGII